VEDDGSNRMNRELIVVVVKALLSAALMEELD
jgi:hypothetical protein